MGNWLQGQEEDTISYSQVKLEGSGRPNVVFLLKARLESHKREIVKIEKFLTLLEKNPGFDELLNLSRELL